MKQPKEIIIPPEMYRIAEKIEKLPPKKKQSLYEFLEKAVDAIVNNHEPTHSRKT